MPGSGPFSTFPQRIGVAVVAIPILVWLAYMGGYWFFGFVAVASALALNEFFDLAERKGAFPLRKTGLLFGFLFQTVFVFDRTQPVIYEALAGIGWPLGMFHMHQYFLVVSVLFLVSVCMVELLRAQGSALANAGSTVLGVGTISVFFGTLVGLRELFPFGFPVQQYFPVAMAGEAELEQISHWGGMTVIILFATIWICDTAAYVAGSTLGKHKLYPSVSPNKTWEGAVAGLVAAILTFVVAGEFFLEYMAPVHAAVLGTFVGTVGQIGDLVESKFKRDAGVKDSSSFLPGHGGVYDRFDSLLFLSPVVYVYVDFIVLS